MSTDGSKIHDFLADSDKLIKAGERSLKKLDKVREEIGLKPGASKEFLEHIPSNSEKNQKAQQELKKFLDGTELNEEDAAPADKKKRKKRSKLAKAMNRQLRI